MTFIPCDCKCKHQKDGYCSLETASAATNSTKIGCAYFVDKEAKPKDKQNSSALQNKNRGMSS
ncbi:hypothetical protein AGMMS50284_1390 [Clostridia bacterium]|nr:hypothetical protein AGMMS50284_1390 [Clostridia bacterium]